MRTEIFYDYLGRISIDQLAKLIGYQTPDVIPDFELIRKQVPSGTLRVGAEFEVTVYDEMEKKFGVIKTPFGEQKKTFLRFVVEAER